MKDTLKKYAKRTLIVAPWVALLVFGVFYTAGLLADWHYREFTEPFLR